MTLVKVCGITRIEDALVAADAGADAVGLIFAPSPRQVDVETAREISAALPDGVLKVGVFVNASPREVLATAEGVGLDLAQLHGDEGPNDVASVRRGGVGVVKAMRVQDEASLEAMEGYGADLYLLDAWRADVRGGTGETFDWGLAKSVVGRDNILVSGGLRPENVREAILAFDPFGVDASSGLEDAPGKKDGEKVRRFVSAARG